MHFDSLSGISRSFRRATQTLKTHKMSAQQIHDAAEWRYENGTEAVNNALKQNKNGKTKLYGRKIRITETDTYFRTQNKKALEPQKTAELKQKTEQKEAEKSRNESRFRKWALKQKQIRQIAPLNKLRAEIAELEAKQAHTQVELQKVGTELELHTTTKNKQLASIARKARQKPQPKKGPDFFESDSLSGFFPIEPENGSSIGKKPSLKQKPSQLRHIQSQRILLGSQKNEFPNAMSPIREIGQDGKYSFRWEGCPPIRQVNPKEQYDGSALHRTWEKEDLQNWKASSEKHFSLARKLLAKQKAKDKRKQHNDFNTRYMEGLIEDPNRLSKPAMGELSTSSSMSSLQHSNATTTPYASTNTSRTGSSIFNEGSIQKPHHENLPPGYFYDAMGRLQPIVIANYHDNAAAYVTSQAILSHSGPMVRKLEKEMKSSEQITSNPEPSSVSPSGKKPEGLMQQSFDPAHSRQALLDELQNQLRGILGHVQDIKKDRKLAKKKEVKAQIEQLDHFLKSPLTSTQ